MFNQPPLRPLYLPRHLPSLTSWLSSDPPRKSYRETMSSWRPGNLDIDSRIRSSVVMDLTRNPGRRLDQEEKAANEQKVYCTISLRGERDSVWYRPNSVTMTGEEWR
ncbi:uncharacterized protein LOC107271428 [Cephus cinctus]|uniref:Uncharacterized protein LOC107271428 n=1 Tax=Cephus cinctus TaxID=211228 RepID=A0AAJ7C685_CEPCN|nr:uncharacterized protein LOC107271428 [Cephus cinctus]